MTKKPKVDLSSLSRKNLVVTNVTTKEKMLPIGYELSGTKNLDEYLFDKATEIVNITRKSRLELGKTFQEVYGKLAGDNQYNGIYTKWLEFYGFNKMTALRHRNRYNLYIEMKSPKTKDLVSKVTDEWINKLIKHEDIDFVLKSLEEDPTKENLGILLSKPIEEIIPLEFNIEVEFKEFSKKYKKLDISNLTDNEKNELHKIITRFNKLIKNDN